MNINILKPASAPRGSGGHLACRNGVAMALTAALLLGTAIARAGVQNGVKVESVCGGGAGPPFYGYVEGNPYITTNVPKFNYPMGLAINSAGDYLFIADYTNNAVRAIDLLSVPAPGNHNYFTYTFTPTPGLTPSGTINRPVGVALDSDDNVYVLNRGNGTNGTVVVFDPYGDFLATYAHALTNANGIALDSSNNVYVTASSNLFRIPVGAPNVVPGAANTVFTNYPTDPAYTNQNYAILTNAKTFLQGLVVMDDGRVAACDSGNNGIVLVDPIHHTNSVLTGFHRAGDNNNIWTNTPNHPVFYTNAMFNQPMGLTKAGNNMLIVADYGNNRVKAVDALGTVTNLYGVTSNLWLPKPPGLWPGWADGQVTVPDAKGDVEARQPNGVLFTRDSTLYVTEDFYHLIRKVTGTSLPAPRPWPPAAPTGLAAAVNCGQVALTWTASSGATNYNIYRSATNGEPYAIITNTTATSYIDTGVLNSTPYYYKVSAVGPGGEGPRSAPVTATPLPPPAPTIMTVFTNYGLVRLTWSTVACPGVTYNVKRSPSSGPPYTIIASNTASTTFSDTSVLNGVTYYYVVSAMTTGGEGTNSPEVAVRPPLPPVPDPQIGYVDFPATSEPVHYTLVFHPVSSFVANNDVSIVILGANGSQTFYTFAATPTNGTIADPTSSSPSAPVGYQDGMFPSQVALYKIGQVMPDLTIKAIGKKSDGSPNSAIVMSRFQFITANPVIGGINFYNFTIGEITDNALLFYTTDGTDPSSTNGVDLSTTATLSSNIWNVRITSTIQSNTLFKVRAFRTNYQPSAIASNWFYASNSIANRLTINSGYYPMGRIIPVTSPVSSVYYTADGSEPTTNSLPVSLTNNVGYIRWFNPTNDLTGLRVKAFAAGGLSETVSGQPAPTNTIGVPPDFNPALYAGIGSQIVVPVVVNLKPNTTIVSYQFRVEISPNGSAPPLTSGFDALSVSTNDFVPLATVAQKGAAATLTVQHYSLGSTNGLEVYAIGNTNNVSFQNFAVAALLRISIPYSASAGDSYALAVSWASATSDGMSDMVPLTLMAPATITVTNIAYKVGDSASMSGGWSIAGGWYNAGGFGNGDLDNSDVNLAFNASLGWHAPFAFSDVFNAMDAYPEDAAGFVGGDGQIRFLDWNVILQRSLRMDTNNWARAWSAGGNLVEVPTTLTASAAAAQEKAKLAPAWPWYRQALLGAVPTGGAVSGARVSVPIYMKVADGATLSGAQFRAVVTPQGSAPALTQAPQLSPASGVPGPTLQQSFKPGDSGFGWALGSFNYQPRSSNFLGWVTFTIPATAQSGQTYALSFANADGAPNLGAQYDFETRSACVAVGTSAPQASVCSDEWKLRFFGSVANPSAGDLADADGDGVPNWMEYVAGTDPTDPTSRLRLSGPARPVGKALSPLALQWLTAPGKAYAVQWSSNLKGGSWTTLATVSGDGNVASCSDTNVSATARYYRLLVLP